MAYAPNQITEVTARMLFSDQVETGRT